MSERIQCGRPVVVAVSAALLLVGLAATAVRIVKQYQPIGPFDPSRQGLCDFHNGVYFPAKAFLAGDSPYGSEYVTDYPVARPLPFYSPVILVMHVPIAILPLRIAEVAYFLISAAIIIAIGFLSASAAGMPRRLDVALAIAAALVFARGGHITLFNGYFTLELVLATLLAVHWADRKPMLAALALAVVSVKPTYILPLGFLLLARGNIRALLMGAVLSIVAAAGPFLWLAAHEGDGDVVAGLASITQQIAETQQVHLADKDESPLHSWSRLDLLAVIAKWVGVEPGQSMHLLAMAVLLILPMFVLNQRRKFAVDDGTAGVTGAIILSGVLVSVYHHSYDALIIVAPVAGVLICRIDSWRRLDFRMRAVLAVLMLVPAYNYLSTNMFLARVDPSPEIVRVLTSLSGLSLAILLCLSCWIGMVPGRGSEDSSCPNSTS